MTLGISRSLWGKALATAVAVVTFVFAYEAGTFDSLKLERQGVMDPTGLATGARHLFTATAYCKGTTTASGVSVRTGIAASDATLLPVGSVVNVTTGTAKYNGVYTIMDTGPKVQGRLLDIYMWSCHDALAFGRQPIEVSVLRLGWNPGDSVPSLVDRLFRRREATTVPRPAPVPTPALTASDETEAATAALDLVRTATEGEASTPSSASPSAASVPDIRQPEQPAALPSAP